MFSIECEEFYNLMQTYRHTPMADQSATLAAYHAVIKYIDEKAEKYGSDKYEEGEKDGEHYVN